MTFRHVRHQFIRFYIIFNVWHTLDSIRHAMRYPSFTQRRHCIVYGENHTINNHTLSYTWRVRFYTFKMCVCICIQCDNNDDDSSNIFKYHRVWIVLIDLLIFRRSSMTSSFSFQFVCILLHAFPLTKRKHSFFLRFFFFFFVFYIFAQTFTVNASSISSKFSTLHFLLFFFSLFDRVIRFSY